MCMCVACVHRGLRSGSSVCVAWLAVARLAVVVLLLCGIAVPSWEWIVLLLIVRLTAERGISQEGLL
jgi:hypothetical protein